MRAPERGVDLDRRSFALDRRSFVRIGATVAGGLLVGVPVGCTPGGEGENSAGGAGGGRGGGTPPIASRLNAFVEVASDDSVTIWAPVPEIGQGVRTALPMLVAEELGVPWERVSVRQAPGEDRYGPRQVAAGSFSVTSYWMPLRIAGAAARDVLVRAAAGRWGVDPGACTTADGQVIDPDGGRRLRYGELAEEAAGLPAADPETLTLTDASDFHLIGTPVPSVDTEAIVRGEPLFGLDVERPGMLRAVVARAPTYGGVLVRYDDAAALQVPGVVGTVPIERVGEPERPLVEEGVAVVAESLWAAIRGRDALDIEWEPGPNADADSASLEAFCTAAVSRRGEILARDDGDVEAGLARAASRVEATYVVPFIAHATMEPMNCTAEVTADRAEFWVPTQTPAGDRGMFARRLDLPPESVAVHALRCGGGFGRRVGAEGSKFEALQVAAALDGRAVQVVYTREDDIRHDAFRPFSIHRLTAGLDASGDVTALRHRQSGTSRHAFRQNSTPDRSEFFSPNFPAGLLDNLRLEYTNAESNLPRTILRAPGSNALAFVVESFVDELARAGGRDPLEYRLALLGEDRDLPYNEDWPTVSTARMANVLRIAAQNAGWGVERGPRRPGRSGSAGGAESTGRAESALSGRGIASYFTFGTYVAYVVDVTVDPSSGEFTIDRVVGAIDCGRPVNPAGIRAQVEGGIQDAVHVARHGEITWEGGAVVQSNFHDYRLARMPEAARDIEVHIVESDLDPTGVGEPPYPPMIPALTNALFDATGVRVRRLPIRLESLRREA